jgi:hypothetical protein
MRFRACVAITAFIYGARRLRSKSAAEDALEP